MNINSRQIHLTEMGVSQWHSRFVLVGAAVSPVITVPSLKVTDSIAKVDKPISLGQLGKEDIILVAPGDGAKEIIGSSIGDKVLPKINGILSDAVKLIDTPELVDEADKSSASQTEGKAVPNVSLGAFSAGNYVVVSEVGDSISHLDEGKLLQNILRPVDDTCSQVKFEGGFNWPVFKSAKVLFGQETLHETLIERWLTTLGLGRGRVLLCFGGSSKKMIEPMVSGSSLLKGGGVVFFEDSLSDLYKIPLRKKNVWIVLSENLNKFKCGNSA
jgi:hypothetical protein